MFKVSLPRHSWYHQRQNVSLWDNLWQYFYLWSQNESKSNKQLRFLKLTQCWRTGGHFSRKLYRKYNITIIKARFLKFELLVDFLALYVKISDDSANSFTAIVKKMCQFRLNINIEGYFLSSRCDIIKWRHQHQKYFVIVCHVLFISDIKMNYIKKIEIFIMAASLTYMSFSTRSCSGRLV